MPPVNLDDDDDDESENEQIDDKDVNDNENDDDDEAEELAHQRPSYDEENGEDTGEDFLSSSQYPAPAPGAAGGNLSTLGTGSDLVKRISRSEQSPAKFAQMHRSVLDNYFLAD